GGCCVGRGGGVAAGWVAVALECCDRLVDGPTILCSEPAGSQCGGHGANHHPVLSHALAVRRDVVPRPLETAKEGHAFRVNALRTRGGHLPFTRRICPSLAPVFAVRADDGHLLLQRRPQAARAPMASRT